MISIFLLSSDNATISSKKSKTVIVKITESFLGRRLKTKEKKYYVKHYVKLVRKSAHFFLYFLLGLSIISFSIEYSPISIKSIIISIIIVFLYACGDEFHQLFVAGRSGEILDVVIDTSGGIFSIILYQNYKKIREKKI